MAVHPGCIRYRIIVFISPFCILALTKVVVYVQQPECMGLGDKSVLGVTYQCRLWSLPVKGTTVLLGRSETETHCGVTRACFLRRRVPSDRNVPPSRRHRITFVMDVVQETPGMLSGSSLDLGMFRHRTPVWLMPLTPESTWLLRLRRQSADAPECDHTTNSIQTTLSASL